MKQEYEFNNKKYIIEKDENNLFDYEQLKELVTNYFDNFDYIFIDEAYNKIRLKGFYEKDNKLYNKINDYKIIDEYIKEYCAYDCKYFIIKKTYKEWFKYEW